MYTEPVSEIIKRHSVKYDWYADDAQLYVTLKPCDKWDDISSSIEACIKGISIRMNNNMLKLNKDKTEFIAFSSKQRLEKNENPIIKIFSLSVKYLWLIG